MKDDLPSVEGLISLLVLWWRYEQQWTPVRGYPKQCPGLEGYRSSRQYDDANGACETDMRGDEAARIGHIIGCMEPLHRAALYDLAKNRATGAAVFRHPLLPADAEERARVVAKALDEFGMMI